LLERLIAIRARVLSTLLADAVLMVCLACSHEVKPQREPLQDSQSRVQQQSPDLNPYATQSSRGPTGLGASLGRGGGLQPNSDVEIIDGVRVYRVGGQIKAPKAIYAAGLDCSTLSTERGHGQKVMLWAVIGSDGRVHEPRVLWAPSTESRDHALTLVAKWRFVPAYFVPAYKEKEPVAVQVNLTVDSCT
jgi:hypothetical protein